MKLLFLLFNPEIRTGGHRRYLDLAVGLAGRGNQVLLIKNRRLSLPLPGLETLELDYPHKKKFLPYSLYSLLLLRRMRKELIAEAGPRDFVLVFGETHFPAGLYLSRLLGARFFYASRSNAVSESFFFAREKTSGLLRRGKFFLTGIKYALYERLIARYADLIAFQSEYDRQYFLSRTRADRGKTCVIPNNIGEPWFQKAHELVKRSERLEKVLYVGSISPRKGISYLLDAVGILKEKGISFSLTLVGRGPGLEEMEAKAAAEGLSDLVHFAGRQADPFSYMKNHDLLIVPSIYDSYPNVVLEALHTGIPVVASRVGGLPDMLPDERCLFPPADAGAIAELLTRLHQDPEEYRELRKICHGFRDRFHFDWPEAWEKAMEEAL